MSYAYAIELYVSKQENDEMMALWNQAHALEVRGDELWEYVCMAIQCGEEADPLEVAELDAVREAFLPMQHELDVWFTKVYAADDVFAGLMYA